MCDTQLGSWGVPSGVNGFKSEEQNKREQFYAPLIILGSHITFRFCIASLPRKTGPITVIQTRALYRQSTSSSK